MPGDPTADSATKPPPGSRFDARIKRVVATRRIFPVLILIVVAILPAKQRTTPPETMP